MSEVIPLPCEKEKSKPKMQNSVKPGFQFQIFKDFADCALGPAAWDEATAKLKGSVYFTFDWLKTWWLFYGKSKELRLFVCKAGEEIVGLVPIYIDKVGWMVPLKVARFVGSNIPPKVFEPPLHPEWAPLCLAKIIEHLLTEDGCDILSFGPVPGVNSPWEKLDDVKAQVVNLAELETVSGGVATVFPLPSTMEEYLESLSKNEQKNRRKYELRTMKKEFPVRVEVLSNPGPELMNDFEAFVQQHTLQWNAEGKPGHFGAWPASLEYNRVLAETQGKLGRLRFIRIMAGEKMVANQYTFAFGGRWFWELPSRIVGKEWDRFSLGPTGIVTMIGEAIKEGVYRIEGGLGHYEYKLRLKAEEFPVKTHRFVARRSGTAVRKHLYDFVRKLLLMGYHKIWYRRITPRLPSKFRKPQWSLWLRFDF